MPCTYFDIPDLQATVCSYSGLKKNKNMTHFESSDVKYIASVWDIRVINIPQRVTFALPESRTNSI